MVAVQEVSRQFDFYFLRSRAVCLGWQRPMLGVRPKLEPGEQSAQAARG